MKTITIELTTQEARALKQMLHELTSDRLDDIEYFVGKIDDAVEASK